MQLRTVKFSNEGIRQTNWLGKDKKVLTGYGQLVAIATIGSLITFGEKAIKLISDFTGDSKNDISEVYPTDTQMPQKTIIFSNQFKGGVEDILSKSPKTSNNVENQDLSPLYRLKRNVEENISKLPENSIQIKQIQALYDDIKDFNSPEVIEQFSKLSDISELSQFYSQLNKNTKELFLKIIEKSSLKKIDSLIKGLASNNNENLLIYIILHYESKNSIAWLINKLNDNQIELLKNVIEETPLNTLIYILKNAEPAKIIESIKQKAGNGEYDLTHDKLISNIPEEEQIIKDRLMKKYDKDFMLILIKLFEHPYYIEKLLDKVGIKAVVEKYKDDTSESKLSFVYWARHTV